MNWDGLGAAAETLGAMGVVITVAYLALQIRQNTRAIRSAAQQSMFDNSHTLRLALSQSPEIAGLLIKAAESYESLTAEEALRFEAFGGTILGEWENVFFQNEHSVVDPDMWEAWDTSYREIFKTQPYRRVWQQQKLQNLEAFRKHVDASIGPEPQP